MSNTDMTVKQKETAVLLREVLGAAIADRYIDYCRLAAGAFDLLVSIPMAAHAMRELESSMRDMLVAPLQGIPPEDRVSDELLEKARDALLALGVAEDAAERSAAALKPKTFHRRQIQLIAASLGFDDQHEVTQRWIAIATEEANQAHLRSAHRRLQVDDQYREEVQKSFEIVIHAVAVALRDRYSAFMKRVDELAAMPQRGRAAKIFVKEIPGSLHLQWRFFQRIEGHKWLDSLRQHNLLEEPAFSLEEPDHHGLRTRQWPVGYYLLTLAKSDEAKSYQELVTLLPRYAASMHPDVQNGCLEIIAALPPEEGGTLVDLAVGWMNLRSGLIAVATVDALLQKLANAGLAEAALKIARAMFQVWEEEGGHRTSLFTATVYDMRLAPTVPLLTKVCGIDALMLFTGLLAQAGASNGRIRHAYHSMRLLEDETHAQNDVFEALAHAVRDSAKLLVTASPQLMPDVLATLTANEEKIFTRLAMKTLAVNPAAAADTAKRYLTDPALIEGTWCQAEYGHLANAGFGLLSPTQQDEVLEVVKAIPDKYVEDWRANAKARGRDPTPLEEERFRAVSLREVVWRWRDVLPDAWKLLLEQIVGRYGGPMRSNPTQHLGPPPHEIDGDQDNIEAVVTSFVSPLPVREGRQPTTAERASTLLAMASDKPKVFSVGAATCEALPAVYMRAMLDGLTHAARNERLLVWEPLLTLAANVIGRYDQPTADGLDEDDATWTLAGHAAVRLLAAGLGRGEKGPPAALREPMLKLILDTVARAPKTEDQQDPDGRVETDPCRAAGKALYGAALNLAFLFMFWLSRDKSTPLGSADATPFETFPSIQHLLEAALADPATAFSARAMTGKYLRLLTYLEHKWLDAHLGELLVSPGDALSEVTWHCHVDTGEVTPTLAERQRAFLVRDIESLDQADWAPAFGSDVSRYREMVALAFTRLYLDDALPAGLFELFVQHSSDALRGIVMDWVGDWASMPIEEGAEDLRPKARRYMELRLADAAARPGSARSMKEFDALGTWCFNERFDASWLRTQLESALRTGFSAGNQHSLLLWLHTHMAEDIDSTVAVLDLLLRDPNTDPWVTMTFDQGIREILWRGLEEGGAGTPARIERLVGYLASTGQAAFLSVLP